MSNYTKSIEVSELWVEAMVIRVGDGKIVQRSVFSSWPWHPASWSLESRLKRAHKWADQALSLVEKYEMPREPELKSLGFKNMMREWRGEYEE